MTTAGVVIDLTTLSRFVSGNTYGSNASVRYISPFFPGGITSVVNNIPVFNLVNSGDFVLFEITLSPVWLENHSVFLFSPYIYNYAGYETFGSSDQSLFITKDQLDVDDKLYICCIT